MSKSLIDAFLVKVVRFKPKGLQAGFTAELRFVNSFGWMMEVVGLSNF